MFTFLLEKYTLGLVLFVGSTYLLIVMFVAGINKILLRPLIYLCNHLSMFEINLLLYNEALCLFRINLNNLLLGLISLCFFFFFFFFVIFLFLLFFCLLFINCFFFFFLRNEIKIFKFYRTEVLIIK
jgi:hypothetical protein